MPYTAPAFNTPTQVAIQAGTRPMPVQQYMLDTVGSAGFITFPIGSQPIVAMLVPQAGIYLVQLLWGIGQTAALVNNNVMLAADNVAITSLLMVAAVNTQSQATVRLTLDSATVLQLKNINSDSGQYLGSMLATRIG